MDRLGFEGIIDILVLKLYALVDHFDLEGRRELFMSSSSVFLFDNTSRYYLVFASLFLTPRALLLHVDYGSVWIELILLKLKTENTVAK